MAFSKSLSPAPLGNDNLDVSFEDETDEAPGLEVILESQLEDDREEAEAMDDEFDADEEEEDKEFSKNLAEDMDKNVLASIASEIISDVEDDINARKDWIQTYVDGLELLGMKIEERTEPWEGACGVYHPLLSEALVKFQAETMTATFPAAGPVRTQMIGRETPEKKDAATRVQDDMNYQLTERMVEYRPEHERMLWGLGLSGNAFKKVYYDPSLQRQVSLFVPAEDVVVPYGASSLETAGRVTHVMRKTPNEVKKLQAAGFYREVDLPDPTDTFDEVEKKIAEQMGFSATTDDRHKLLEAHIDLDLASYDAADDKVDEETTKAGIAVPYVVTIDKASSTILAIRRNWKPDDPTQQKRNHFVHYAYIPGFGFYAFGLIHLIGAFAKSGTSIIRQLVDAGTLSNLPGGYKTKGLRIKGDDTPIGPGEFRDVDVASGTMRDNIMPLPYKEPSQVLLVLLEKIVEEGRRFAGAADLQVSDMSAQAPVGTTLAILERTLKVMSAVQARIHFAMRQEFRLLRDIIRDYTPDEYSYEPEEGTAHAKKSDYDLVTVIPVSDPNAATMAQKVVQYQAVIQMAQMAPQIYDLPYLHRQMLEVMDIKNVGKLIPTEDDQKPRDPVSENMDMINSKPVKAFIAQDHEAHLIVHTAAMQDPEIQKLMGQNPQAPALMAAMQAHILEHVAFQYRKQIEEAAGVPYPEPDAEMDGATEAEISRLAAAAAGKVLATNQGKAQQAQAQQAMQDPLVQMQQAELEIKKKDQELKERKFAADIALASDKHDLEVEKLEAQERIAGLQVGAKIAGEKERISSEDLRAGLKMGIDVAREESARTHGDEGTKGKQSFEERRQAKDQLHQLMMGMPGGIGGSPLGQTPEELPTDQPEAETTVDE